MSLDSNEIARLLELLAATTEHEINCDECLALVAEFAERKLAGLSLSAGLQLVEQHLEVCDECREEYFALQRTLANLDCTRPDDNENVAR
ncbi:MAG: hypothetical protein KDA61_17445 [Planctomycetales bacterium]|nr:hypothetical protein [Planctomycetales bacterium]